MKNRDVPETLVIGDDSTSPGFNPENPTKIFIHGFIASADKYAEYPKAYFNNGLDYNVVLVDWKKGSWNFDIVGATNTSILVAEFVSEVLKYFIDSRSLDVSNLYIAGHSMGAHMAGIVGHRLGGNVAEVIGLDPANHLYEDQPMENQVDSSDAKFVQIIHSNGGRAGIEYPRGHVDFYPNGGTNQTGCEKATFLSDGCSHNIIIDFYLESIKSRDFVATRCDTYDDYLEGKCSERFHTVMGENTPSNSENGTYYLHTNPEPPHAEGNIGL